MPLTVRGRFAPLLFAVAGLFAWAGLAHAQAAVGRVPTVTRLVKLFSEAEGRLDDALAAGDANAAGAFLTDDFELRAGPAPGTPVPRAEWLRQSIAEAGAHHELRQMAVHDQGSVAIVSFLETPRTDGQSTSGPNGAGTRNATVRFFVVDVWKRAGEGWKLATRYAAPAGDAQTHIPGVPVASEPPIQKRY